MSKVLLDSNVIIAMGKGTLPTSVVKERELFVSDISRLEVFGYHNLRRIEREALVVFLKTSP